MNQIIIKGRLTADIELKQTANNSSYCHFTVAVDRPGSKEDRKTDFFRCTAWRQTAEFIGKYFSKGQEILLRGSMENNQFTKDGANRDSWEVNVADVEFCGSKGQGGETSSGGGARASKPKTAGANKPAKPAISDDDDDDGLPF